MWARVIEILGFEQAELLRREFKGELLQVPGNVPREVVIAREKDRLVKKRYREIAEEYHLTERTVRRYEKYMRSVREDVLVR